MIQKRRGAEGVRFVVYLKSNGRRFYVGSYDSRKLAQEAEQDAAVTRRRIDKGELAEDVDLQRTFKEASGEWIESLEARQSRSADTYQKRLALCLWKEFGATPITDISKPMVMAFRDRLATKLKPATVNSYLICLSSAYSYFVDRQWVTSNPCHRVKPVENPETEYGWIHTKEEITRLLANSSGDLREMMALTLATGLRLDEMLHLQWADIDISKRLIVVHRGSKGATKSGKLRRVPILDSVLSMLTERNLRRGGDSLVFPAPARGLKKRGAVRTKQGVRDIFKLALKRANLDTTLRWHDLRHTMASHWMMDGGDIFKLSRILGHSNVKMTLRYSHLAPTAFEPDYGRLSFHVPTDDAPVRQLIRGDGGKLIGTRSISRAG